MNRTALLNELKKDDEEKRLAKAKAALVRIVTELKARGEDNEGCARILKRVISVFIASDHLASETQHRFLNKLFNTEVSSEGFLAMIDGAAREAYVVEVTKFIATFGEETKKAFLTLGLCFILADDYVSKEELRMCERIFG